jgi:2-polyprenyl-3-methyl-5-hydroxy-6-metoxy-1,4-benzoquinol methylase
LLDPATPHFARMGGVSQRHLDVVRRWTKPGRMLDVGCSNGQFLDLAQRAGYTTDGVEFSTGVADFARQHFGLNVTNGDIHAVTAPDESYDVITMFDVIEHVPDPLSDMAAAHRLLKPGGIFILSTPNIDGIYPRLSLKVAKLINYWQHPEPPHHLFQFSEKTLSAMLDKSGFDVGKRHHINIDLSYSFGSWATLLKLPSRAAYALAFAPFSKIGPWFKSGDWFYLAATKR